MRTRNLSILALAAGLLLFFVFGLAWISRPGPYQDEMLFLNGAFSNHPIVSYAGGMRIFKHDVPLMLMPYVGATKGLLWRLVFLIWPPSVYSARVPIVVLAGLALVLFYLWARRYYSPGVAGTAALLAAADPSYIFTSRLDWGPVVIQRLLMAAGLLLAARWLESDAGGDAAFPPLAAGASGAGASVAVQAAAPAERQQPHSQARSLAWLGASGFCFGLGLWDKTSFAWFLIALGITVAVLFPHDLRRRLRPAPVAVFALALLIGAYPLLRYNFSRQAGGKTYSAVHLAPSESLTKVSRLKDAILDGRFVYSWVAGWAFDPAKAEVGADGPGKMLASLSKLGPKWGTLFPWVLTLAVIAACVASGKRRLILFPLMITALMWLQVLPLKEGGGAHHYALAYPFPHLAVAAAAGWCWDRLRGGFRLAPVTVAAAVVLTMIGWDAATVWQFRETGGGWNWSDASYEITGYLEKRQPATLMCMDWGFSYPLLLLSNGRLNERDFFADVAFSAPEEFPKHVQRMIPQLLEPNTLYIFHAGGFQCFPNVRKVFDEALNRTGMREKVIATFKMRNGANVAVLSEAVSASGEAIPAGTLAFRVAPAEVSPGGQYAVDCPELGGKEIDLLYVRSTEQAEVSDRFARLDAQGRVVITTPKLTPKGKIAIMAVRESGAGVWRPVSASITVK